MILKDFIKDNYDIDCKNEETRNVISQLKAKGLDVLDDFDNYYGTNTKILKKDDIDVEIMKKFNIESLYEKGIIPYGENEKNMYVLTNNLILGEVESLLQGRLKQIYPDKEVVFFYTHKFHLEEVKKNYDERLKMKETTKEEIYDEELLEDTTEWANKVLEKGITKRASDIHIESIPNAIKVRYRIDGILAKPDIYETTKEKQNQMIARIKIMAGMDVAEKRAAQDGQISNFKYNNRIFDMRVSSVNTIHGEKIVLRLAEKTGEVLTFNQLGINEEDERRIKKLLSNKEGIIYITGPTGSGKTTTLYSMIDHLNTEDVNIYSIEDPVEKDIPGINQIEIDVLGGVTFYKTLEALLRQDPNIIVVGEVRDKETAKLALEASTTGHLVLATVHSNRAVETVNRLYGLGLETYLISTTSLSYMSQRLIRKNCEHCKIEISPKDLTSTEKAYIAEVDEKYGYNFKERFESINKLYRSNDKGCPQCIGGYYGRFAVLENLEQTKDIKEMVAERKTSQQILDKALQNGYRTLEYLGLEAVLRGDTDIKELIKNI